MRTSNINLHIEELVLHGFAPGDRYTIADPVERELSRLLTEDFADPGYSSLLTSNTGPARLDAGLTKRTPTRTNLQILLRRHPPSLLSEAAYCHANALAVDRRDWQENAKSAASRAFHFTAQLGTRHSQSDLIMQCRALFMKGCVLRDSHSILK